MTFKDDIIGETYEKLQTLLKAAEDCRADLAHYVATHGPGPDRRLEALDAAITKAKGELS